MKYDFDSIVERKHTHSTKWLKFSDPNIIPMWIADMDFACPKEITDPMRERVDQGIFGYTDTPDELTQILKDRIAFWMGHRRRVGCLGTRSCGCIKFSM